MKVGVIGYGRIGSAIAKSLADKNEIICIDQNESNTSHAKEMGLKIANSLQEIAKNSDFIFLCVKPKDITTVLSEIKHFIKSHTIISIAAGKKISSLQKIIGTKKIVRVMPNIAALAASSANVFTCINMNAKDKEEVTDLLSLFGSPIEMDEKYFDAVTALSGSGPAFVAYFIQALAHAGEENGLGKEEAHTLTLETVMGTTKLMKQLKLSPQEVIEMVSSPNGTTVAGRKILENGEFSRILKEAVGAAKKRSEELGKDE